MGMANFRKGDPNFFRPKPFRRGPYFEKVTFSFFTPSFGVWNKWPDDIQRFLILIFQPFVNMNFQRRPKSLIPPEEVWNYAAHSWLLRLRQLSMYNIMTILSPLILSVWDVKGQTATFHAHEQRGKHPALWEDEGAEDAWTNGTHGARPESLGAATVFHSAESSRKKSQMVLLAFLMRKLLSFFSVSFFF